MLRDRVYNSVDQHQMCDCLITNPTENKITLAELKHTKKQSGQINKRLVDEAREQFCGGLLVLHKVLVKTQKSEVDLQIVLFTKSKITDSSELKRLRKPLNHHTKNISILSRECGCDLPSAYRRLHRSTA